MADDDLMLPFDSNNREFIRGFQLGIVWGRIASPYDGVMVFTENAEMLIRMQEHFPQAFTVEDAGEVLAVTFADAEGEG